MHYPNSERQRRNSETQLNPTQCTQQHFYMTARGANQALRNRSDQIWSALGNNGLSFSPCYMHRDYQSTHPTLQISEIGASGRKDQKQQFTITRPDKQKDRSLQLSSREDGRSRTKSVSFNLIGEDKIKQSSGQSNEKVLKDNRNQNQNKRIRISSQSKQRQKSRQIETIQLKQKKPLTRQEQQKRHVFLKECFSIDQYLKTHKAQTRTMPNSTIKLFYQRPCLQAYGRKNTTGNNGFIYNDFMKTHNVLPHRLGNEPVKYQAYRSALNFCKRTKVDPEQRWKKIHRQMRKKMDMKLLVEYFAGGVIDVDNQNLQEALKLNINTLQGTYFQRSKSLGNLEKLPASQRFSNQDTTMLTAAKTNKLDFNSTRASSDLKQTGESERISSLKRSKSWGKKQYLFLYKYKDKDGDVQYCKDRHGITCYVDPTFEQNKDAYTKWLKKIKPIQAQEVSASDRNIDQQLLNNHIISKQQQNMAKHYLLPNCDQPQRYKAQKYSIKGRKRNKIQQKEIKQIQ